MKCFSSGVEGEDRPIPEGRNGIRPSATSFSCDPKDQTHQPACHGHPQADPQAPRPEPQRHPVTSRGHLHAPEDGVGPVDGNVEAIHCRLPAGVKGVREDQQGGSVRLHIQDDLVRAVASDPDPSSTFPVEPRPVLDDGDLLRTEAFVQHPFQRLAVVVYDLRSVNQPDSGEGSGVEVDVDSRVFTKTGQIPSPPGGAPLGTTMYLTPSIR